MELATAVSAREGGRWTRGCSRQPSRFADGLASISVLESSFEMIFVAEEKASSWT